MKDAVRGLLDFPRSVAGVPAYWCWRVGEPDRVAASSGRGLRRSPAHRRGTRVAAGYPLQVCEPRGLTGASDAFRGKKLAPVASLPAGKTATRVQRLSGWTGVHSMASVQDSTSIASRAETVFDALADPAVQVTYDGQMFRSVQKLTPGPISRGTHFRGDFKGMGKVEYEYSEFEPNQLIEHAVKMPFGHARHRFEFQPQGDGTRLVQTITVFPNLLGRLLWPVIIQRMMSKRVRTLNALVKAYAERQAAR
jgi:uncharacterized protein YndB with AHSA1/START domain